MADGKVTLQTKDEINKLTDSFSLYIDKLKFTEENFNFLKLAFKLNEKLKNKNLEIIDLLLEQNELLKEHIKLLEKSIPQK